MKEATIPCLPAWLPDALRCYLDHINRGLSLRALARREGLHPSTVLRQVRRLESRRDDPLIDEAITAIGLAVLPKSRNAITTIRKDSTAMTAPIRNAAMMIDDETLQREGRRMLRRLAETGAFLAIAPEMEKAIVLREFPDGRSTRTGVVERAVAQAFVLKDWIAPRKTGRVTTYEITTVGRAALKRMLDLADAHRDPGLAEAATPFADQHRDWDSRVVQDGPQTRRMRYNMAESPIAVLGRRRDRDGKLFLEADMIEAAERLREDFELAQMGPRVAQNWDRFLTAGDRGSFRPDAGVAEGPRSARDRVALALRDLGPGLGDVVLRVCCYLEGIETAEKRMGWASRSGKIVLRIALMRLKRHYDETYGKAGILIG
ncbi:MAG: helix-turn-helix domain-containing protein [Rhodobacteraceae bacterium]|nr:helix-turn-helix domain-containing protein [Paracoccaceae bacterium]